MDSAEQPPTTRMTSTSDQSQGHTGDRRCDWPDGRLPARTAKGPPVKSLLSASTIPRSPEPATAARAAILMSATLTIMAAAIIAPSLPAMTAEYADTPGAEVLVRLTLTVTSLAIAVTAPVAGLLADRIGRRPLLLTSLALYAPAGSAGYLITNLGVLIASRALLGAAVGGAMTAVSTVIADWFDGPRRARFLGLQQPPPASAAWCSSPWPACWPAGWPTSRREHLSCSTP
ncbi:MFS transporter [Micromonospora sp. CPCC 206060]|uniref:MFS transporter n=1 Tax=Micromonospora sp. CPCC 206060 TaxID=3122406 RepID=UPI002FEF863A